MTITRYNCTGDARAVALSGMIDTVPITAVYFSHPSGSLRLNDFVQFTHFTATFEGTTYIYRVMRFKAINSGVCEIEYELDYMKDFFSKNPLATATGGIVIRSTNVADWKRWVVDPSGPVLSCRSQATNVLGNTVSGKMYGLVLNSTTYILSETQLRGLVTYLQTSPNAMKMYNSINRCYALPISLASDLTGITYTPAEIPAQDETSTGVWGHLVETTGQTYRDYDTGLSVSLTSYHDFTDKEHILYVPFAGSTRLPVNSLAIAPPIDNVITLPIHVRLYFNLVDGAISYQLKSTAGALVGTLSPAIALPTIGLPSGSVAYNQFALTKQYEQSVKTSLLTGAGAVAAGAITANPIAVVGGAALAVGGVINASMKGDMQKDLAAIQGDTIGSASGYMGLYNNRFGLTTIEPLHPVSLTDWAVSHGYNTYLVMGSNFVPVAGNRYWIDAQNLTVSGPSWYAEAVKREISKEYIVYQ